MVELVVCNFFLFPSRRGFVTLEHFFLLLLYNQQVVSCSKIIQRKLHLILIPLEYSSKFPSTRKRMYKTKRIRNLHMDMYGIYMCVYVCMFVF